MDGTLAWSSKARSPTCSRSCSARPPTACRRTGRGCNGGCAIFYRRLQQLNRADARAAQRRASLRSRRPALFAVPRRRPAILLRLFRDARPVARRRPARQEAPSRRQAAARTADQRVLDIGCGWGGLALYLAEFCRAHVTGITLSQEQWQRASERAAEKSLTGSVDFRMQDYRDLQEQFDRIVSVGMFEHVGLGLLRRVLPQMRRAAGRRRRHAAAFDRPLRGPQRHQSLDRQIHLPRRLYPGAVGGAAGDRARRPAGHRHRDPAAALRRDAARPGASASSPTARRPSASTTSASCGCGSSTWPPPRWRSASRP